MISRIFAQYMNSLSLNKNAERIVNIFPLGTIYWSDEVVHESLFQWMPPEIKDPLFRLFEIRRQKWKGAILSNDDEIFWNEASGLFSKCPIFQRQELSVDDREALRIVDSEVASFLEASEELPELERPFASAIEIEKAVDIHDIPTDRLLTSGDYQTVDNSLMIIYPYKRDGIWMFDDPAKGLSCEPFVSGADEIIEKAVSEMPNANSGFVLIFSAFAFPTHQLALEWEREEYGGHWYYSRNFDMRGWLCPALFKYFDAPPKCLFARFQEREEGPQGAVSKQDDLW